MNINYFTTPDTVKEICSHIDRNVDNELIVSAIFDAQRVHLYPVLGKDLYNKISSDIENDTLTGIYSDIYDELQIPMSYWTSFELVQFLNTKYTNVNLGQKSTDNSQPADLQREIYIRKSSESKAQSVTKDLVNFLETNKLIISEYNLFINKNKNDFAYTDIYTGNNLYKKDKYSSDNDRPTFINF